MTFGQKCGLLRKQNGLSQEQLAEKLSVSRQAVSKWELDTSYPDTVNVVELSALFGVSTDYLLKDDMERDREVITESPKPPAGNAGKYRTVIAILCVCFSIVSYFVVWVLEKVFPAPIVFQNADTGLWKVGLENFIWIHGLENFMLLLGMLFVVGLGLILYNLWSTSS